MSEIIANRTYKKKEFDLGGGVIQHEMHIGDIHYPDGAGGFLESDFTIIDQGNRWEVTACNYRVYIAKTFLATTPQGGDNLILWRNRRNSANHGILFRPHSLRWINNIDLSDMQLFRNAVDVAGILTQEDSSGEITFANCFGTNIDFVFEIMRHGFRMVLRINQKNALENPPTANHKLAFLSKYDAEGTALKLKARDALSDWDELTYYESEGAFDLTEGGDVLKRTIFRPARIWDSGGLDDFMSENIKVFWTKYGGALWKAKILPKTFLQNATYPVMTDASPAYSESSDGNSRHSAIDTWANVREGAGTGSAFAESADDADMIRVSYKSSNGTRMIYRSFFSFDLSGEAGGTVDSATLSLYGDSKILIGSPTDGGIAVQDAAPATSGTFVQGDYELGVAAPYLDPSAAQVFNAPGDTLVADWDTAADYVDITLDSDGWAFISSALGSGYADFMVREYYHDVSDNTPPADDYVIAKTRFQENVTGYDPKLTWTTGGIVVPTAWHHLNKH